MFLQVFSAELLQTPNLLKLALHLLQSADLEVVLHGGSLTGDPTAIGAHQRVVATLWPVNVGHYLVRSFEGTVRTNVVPFDALLSEVVLQVLLVDLVLAFQGAVDVSVLTVSCVRVQVNIQVFQWPTPPTPPLLHTALDSERQDLPLVLDLLQGFKAFLSTPRARLVVLLCGVDTVIAITLTATGCDCQPPSHQGTLLAVEIFRNRVYKLTLIT